MPALNRDLYESLCPSNKKFLRDEDFISDDNNLSIDLGDNSNQIIDQLIENEKSNKQKENFKSNYVMQLMTIGFMLLAAGFALAPLFIATIIVLPILPILLIGFAILAGIKFIFSLKNNAIETRVTHIANTLDQLKDVGENEERGIRNILDSVKGLKNIIVEGDEKKMVEIAEIKETTQNTAQLLATLGTFPTAPITIPHSEPANEFHDRERASSPSNS